MRLIVSVIFLIISNIVVGQEEDNNYKSLYSIHSIGINEVTKDSIYAQDVSFVNNISDFVYDTFSNILLSYFALYGNEGKTSLDYITAYSLEEKKVLWSRLVERTRAQYQFINGKLYLITDEHSGLIDIRTDTFKWKINSRIFLNSELVNKNIALAPLYHFKKGGKVFAALNASTGDTIWINEKLELKMGIIAEPNLIGDSFIFLNEYLHLLNIKTGEFWKNKNKINKIFDKSDIFWREFSSGLVYAMAGSFFGTAYNYSLYNFYRSNIEEAGLQTNGPLVIEDFKKIYVVGQDGMRKFDLHGNMLGAISHNNKDNNSSIIKIKNQIYYSELGSYIRNNEKRGVLASYFYISKLDSSLSTLNRCYLNDEYVQLSKELGLYHVRTEFLHDTFFVLFRSGILVLDTNLNILGKFSRSKKEDPEYRNLLLNDFYVYSDSAWIKQHNGNSLKYLERLDKSIDVVNSQFQLVKNIPRRDIYKIYYQDDLITAAVNADGKSFLLDRKDRAIIDMVRIEKIQKHNDQYYIANLNGYFIIKADQLVK